MKYGIFVNPTPKSLSDLQNDNNYMAIKEYPLTPEVLLKGHSFVINDLKAGSIIINISLEVKTPFITKMNNDAIEVVTDSNNVLFSKNINDLNVTGKYMTDCYYITNGNINEIIVNHTLNPNPNKFVTVSYDGYFSYSTDGINWTESTISSTSRYWYSVCYGNDKFVAVPMESNTFAYSTDGINWTETSNGLNSRRWRTICYGNGKFVTIAYSSKYSAYSTDGITWTESTISDTSRNWNSVCYGNGKFVAVAYNSNYFAYGSYTPMPSDLVPVN